jgi:hypothetical protein
MEQCGGGGDNDDGDNDYSNSDQTIKQTNQTILTPQPFLFLLCFSTTTNHLNIYQALELGLETRDIEALRLFADLDGDGVVNPQEFMRFAFSSLLHLLREQALQVASDMVGGGDAHEDGEVLIG